MIATEKTGASDATVAGGTSPVQSARRRGFWAWLTAPFEIPFGYEDESGFHYGHPPQPQRNEWSSPARPLLHTDRAEFAMRHPLNAPIAAAAQAEADVAAATPPLKHCAA